MITISVCVGSACHLKGAYNIINKLKYLIGKHKVENNVEIRASFCLGTCTNAVSVKVDDYPVCSVNEDTAEDFFNRFIIERL